MVVVLSLFRFFFLIFAVFCYVCLLSISSIASQEVFVSVEQPYIRETTTRFNVYGVENFDGLSGGWHDSYESNFNSPGYGEWCQGNYNTEESDNPIRGIYNSFYSYSNSLYGGAGPAVGSFMASFSTVLNITHGGPDGINYFGFHGESLDPDNRVQLYSGDDMIFELDMTDVINYVALRFKSNYMFNPNPDEKERKPRKAFVYVNIYIDGATFDSVKILSNTNPFESDVHTIGFSTKRPNAVVPIRTRFIRPKNFTPVTTVTTITPWRRCPRGGIRIEGPFITDTNTEFHWGDVREDFDAIPTGFHDSYVTHFGKNSQDPNDPLSALYYSGTYSSFTIKENSEKGGAGSSGRFFSAVDSWLNVTVPAGNTGPNVFGAYINSANPASSLEFYLKDELIFIFYLVDSIDFLQDKPLYLGNPAYLLNPEAEKKDLFFYQNIYFDFSPYDAVRFRSKFGTFESDNHALGRLFGLSGEEVYLRRTVVKSKLGLHQQPPPIRHRPNNNKFSSKFNRNPYKQKQPL